MDDLKKAVEDILPHIDSWRSLLATVPKDKEGYVEHEINAFDRDMGALVKAYKGAK